MAEEDKLHIEDTNPFTMPMDFTIEAKTIGKLIINKEDGTRIEIPFSEIVKALEE